MRKCVRFGLCVRVHIVYTRRFADADADRPDCAHTMLCVLTVMLFALCTVLNSTAAQSYWCA